MFANGVSLGRQTSDVHFFCFNVPNTGETVLKAIAGECTDESFLRKVEVFNEAYRLKEEGAILNWFDIDAPEGFYSLNDKISDILKSREGQEIFGQMMGDMTGKKAMGFEINEGMMQMMGGFTMLRMLTLMGGMMDMRFTKEQLLELNARLNQIKK